MCLLHYCSTVSSLWWLNNWEKCFSTAAANTLVTIAPCIVPSVLCFCWLTSLVHCMRVFTLSVVPLQVTVCMVSHGKNGSLPLYCSISLIGSHMDAKTRTPLCMFCWCHWLGQCLVQVFVPLAISSYCDCNVALHPDGLSVHSPLPQDKSHVLRIAAQLPAQLLPSTVTTLYYVCVMFVQATTHLPKHYKSTSLRVLASAMTSSTDCCLSLIWFIIVHDSMALPLPFGFGLCYHLSTSFMIGFVAYVCCLRIWIDFSSQVAMAPTVCLMYMRLPKCYIWFCIQRFKSYNGFSQILQQPWSPQAFIGLCGGLPFTANTCVG